jgi:DNA-binding NtrC family response regulator
MAQRILIVEDDPAQLRYLEEVIAALGYDVEVANSGEAAVEFLSLDGQKIDLVLLDLVLPGIDGVEVLEKTKPALPDLPIIILTMQGGVGTVVRAMRAGAADFFVKPASPERLRVSIENALKVRTLTGELSRMSRRLNGEMGFDDLIGRSAGMAAAIELARRGAKSNIPILIEGESGVGKEMIARAIQGSGERARKPFVTVNCGALPQTLVESILFGHEKGSFTGATGRHLGKFQEASGGTLFLDEVGELAPDIQVKLLRALQQGEIDPVGSKTPITVDIRLMSATNKDLLAAVNEGRFREDLYYRLNVFPISVPPLRERPDDIAPLVEYFIARFAASEGKGVRGASDEAMTLLNQYGWPGNVRQLENSVFSGVVLCDGEVLEVSDFPQIAQQFGLPAAATDSPADGEALPGDALRIVQPSGALRTLKEVEEDMIRAALDRHGGHMSKVARELGIGRSTLYRKVRGIEGMDQA